jgi:hypothetical protein
MEAKIEALLAQAEAQQANGQTAQETSDAQDGDKAGSSS